MDDITRVKRLLIMAQRLHAMSKKFDPNDPECGRVEDTLAEVAQALQDIEEASKEKEEEEHSLF